jgi:E3 ubiquitin-protein ligase TRIP12
LKENGEDIPLTSENISQYLDSALDFYFGSGIERQVKAFKEGFETFLPLVRSSFQAYTDFLLGKVANVPTRRARPSTMRRKI